MEVFNWQLVIGAGFTMLALAVAHWFPHTRKLDRIQAYTVGTLLLLAGQAIWLISSGLWPVAVGVAAIDILGGAIVWGAYRIDEGKNKAARLRANEKAQNE